MSLRERLELEGDSFIGMLFKLNRDMVLDWESRCRRLMQEYGIEENQTLGNYSLKSGARSRHDAIAAIELKQRTLLMSETTEKLQFSIGDSEEHKRRDQLMHT